MVLRPPEMGIAAAAAGIGALSKSRLPPVAAAARSLAASPCRRRRSSLASPDIGTSPPTSDTGGGEGFETPAWKTVSSRRLGIEESMISKPTWNVLNALKKKGHEVYLVGGCVRDLIMKRTPKDFDIITTADLREVQKTFGCIIVGKRFPICHVKEKSTIVEVSSFNTSVQKPNNCLVNFSRRPDCNKDDYVRWKNCLGRDFTINGLMFNPYSEEIYDYLGGMEDIRKAKVRTVIHANTSFQEDCARILRAIRIAARLGFSFSRETAYSVKDLAYSVLRLDKGRILMELNYMLAYGSAEASLRLLWKFGLLELLLPIQAAYFVSHGFRRLDKRTNMLLELFSNLDRLLAPDKPSHSCLWISILAFHEALARMPRDPLVVATFALALHNGGNMGEAVDIAKRITCPHVASFPELVKPRGWELEGDLVAEVLDLASSTIAALSSMTDEHLVSQAMAKYPQAPYSDLVFIPLQSYLKVCTIFNCVSHGERGRGFKPKYGNKINYKNLVAGGIAEVRHVFARVVFDTMFLPNQENQDAEAMPEDQT